MMARIVENIGDRWLRSIAAAMTIAALTACTIHPQGESRERRDANIAGKPYAHRVEDRKLPVLSATATPEELVTFAQLNNAELEQKYWNWRSAIEQIPQEGTQKTNVMITFNSMITNGTTAAAMNTLGIGNDAMNNIVLPNKLGTAARVALENARAAGLRFDQARLDLRTKLLAAYVDYALTAEVIRLEQRNKELLDVIRNVTQSRVGTGGATQQDSLKTMNESDASDNEMRMQQAKLPAELAVVNAILNRDPDAPLKPPSALPTIVASTQSDKDILERAAAKNSELLAQSHDIAGKREAISRAKAEYLPDFGINASTDFAGVTQSLMGSIMLPVLRYHAIDAGIRQAEANLRSAEEMLRQSRYDLASRVAGDLAMIRDLDRQIAFYEGTLLPRAHQIISASQSTFATGHSSLLDILDSERSLIALERMVVEFRASRVKQAADLEAALGA